MELSRQKVNGGWSRLPTPEDAEDTEFRRRYTNTDILHIKKKKKQESQKCDQEPIFKTYLFCLLFSTQAKKMLFANSRRPHKRDP